MNFYKINNSKFKSIYFSFNFTMPVTEKENSENAVLASVLSKSCQVYKTQKDIEKFLYNMYGANFDTVVEKYGDLYNIEFRIECINKKFLPNNIDVIGDCLKFMYEMIFNPNMTDFKFNDELVDLEKKYILSRIKERKDDKLQYAVSRTEELLTYPQPFGMYVYGDEEKVSKITPEDLCKRYQGMLKNSCITVIASGNLDGYTNIEQEIDNIFSNKLNSNLEYSSLIYDTRICNDITKEVHEITEIQDTVQSVITFGLRIKGSKSKMDFYILNLYNTILGGTPSSKLFTNFREKESLAYTVRSRYYRYKAIIVIYAGIQKTDYDKAKSVVIKELNEIEIGNISDEEFNTAKQSLVADLLDWNDSKIALSKLLLSNILVYKNNNITIDDMIKNIESITKEQVIDMAKRVELEQILLLGGELDV
ncbi:MAG: pitrilysin family protein [Clostridia bacterium]